MKKFSLIIGLVVGLTLGACTIFYAADSDKDQGKESWSQRFKKKLKGANSSSKSTSTPTPAPEPMPEAKIDTVTGSGRILRWGESEFVPLMKGDQLFVGDIVVTGEDSEARIMGNVLNSRRMTLSMEDNAIIVITKRYLDEENEQRFFRILQGSGGVKAADIVIQGVVKSNPKKGKDYTINSAIDMSDR